MTKLVLCLDCQSIFVPWQWGFNTCLMPCEKSRVEWLEDRRTLEVVGNCVVIGINNTSLAGALERWDETKSWPEGTRGRTTGLGVEAYIIPEGSQWVRRVPELTSDVQKRDKVRAQQRASAAARRAREKDAS